MLDEGIYTAIEAKIATETHAIIAVALRDPRGVEICSLLASSLFFST
jgi:hypothetical protein